MTSQLNTDNNLIVHHAFGTKLEDLLSEELALNSAINKLKTSLDTIVGRIKSHQWDLIS